MTDALISWTAARFSLKILMTRKLASTSTIDYAFIERKLCWRTKITLTTYIYQNIMGEESEITYNYFAWTRCRRQAFLAIRKLARRYIAMSHSWFSDNSLERYFTEAIYRDDVWHALRYIVIAVYRRNVVSLGRFIVGTRYRRKPPISRRFIVLKVSRKWTIYRKNKAR